MVSALPVHPPRTSRRCPLPTRKPRILILASDPFSASIRLAPFLDCLYFDGAIEGYCVVDRDLSPVGPHRFTDFTHVVAQRNPSSNQFRWLQAAKVPFCYDIDDLVTELPARAHKRDETTRTRIAWCLDNAAAVTTPGGRLPAALEASTGIVFAARHVPLPNGLWPQAVDPARWQQPARTLVWVSSDIPLIAMEAPRFAETVAAVAKDLSLTPLLIGRFAPETLALFSQARHIPRLDYADYRHLLGVIASPMAIAPLPIAAGRHQPFIDAKSDIKIVDFQGHGVPAIYSRAAPYVGSDLAPPMLIDNDPDVWAEQLRRAVPEPGRLITQGGVDAIQRLRSYAVLAPTLLEALDSAATSIPAPRPSLSGVARRAEQSIRGIWRSVRGG